MKKKGILIIVFLIIGIATFSIYKYSHRVKPHVYKTDVDRDNYINEFAKVQYPDNKEPNVITENAGGIQEIRILNRGILMKYNDVGIMTSTDQKITDSMKILPALYSDTNGYKDDEIKAYFEKNKRTIITTLGIDTEIKLKEFIETLVFLKDTTIKEASIDESSLNKEGNIITFKLTITTDNNKTAIYPLKIIVSELNGKANCLVYWK